MNPHTHIGVIGAGQSNALTGTIVQHALASIDAPYEVITFEKLRTLIGSWDSLTRMKPTPRHDDPEQEHFYALLAACGEIFMPMGYCFVSALGGPDPIDAIPPIEEPWPQMTLPMEYSSSISERDAQVLPIVLAIVVVRGMRTGAWSESFARLAVSQRADVPLEYSMLYMNSVANYIKRNNSLDKSEAMLCEACAYHGLS